MKDINPNGNSQTTAFTRYNNKIYFSAFHDSTGYELWMTDGTEQGTELVIDLRPGPKGMVGGSICVYQNLLFFGGGIANTGSELCVSDGTAAGTKLIKDI